MSRSDAEVTTAAAVSGHMDQVDGLRVEVGRHVLGFRSPSLAVCSCGRWARRGSDRECHAGYREHIFCVALDYGDAARKSVEQEEAINGRPTP